jgi:vancomycin resistance protein YoaR
MSRRVAAVAVLLCAAAAGAWWGWSTAPSRVVVRVDGAEHDGSLAWEEFVARRAERLGRRELHVRVDGQSYPFAQEDLGLTLDRHRLDAARVAHTESGRLPAWKGWFASPEPTDLPLTFQLDEERARRALESLGRAVRREPVDARVLVREHRVIQAEPGLELDVEQTLEALRRADPSAQLLIEAAIERPQPRVTDDMVLPIDVSKVLAVYETNFKKKAGARAVNIARAARYLDQTVLAPGEVFSFNRVVGERSHERGFVDAPVIVNDEMEKDVGGGVCQVASTLHAAAIFGNLEIVRRRSHSRPSGYAPLGLDATVIDGTQDLRIKNPFDTPVLIHAYLPSKYVIRVELLGREPDARVEHQYTVSETKPYSRRIWRRPELAAGTFEQKQDGSPGYEVMSWVTVNRPGGAVERRNYPSRYYPVPEVFWVSSDFDLRKLPPLPKGVTEVVVDGQADERASAEDAARKPGASFDVL